MRGLSTTQRYQTPSQVRPAASRRFPDVGRTVLCAPARITHAPEQRANTTVRPTFLITGVVLTGSTTREGGGSTQKAPPGEVTGRRHLTVFLR